MIKYRFTYFDGSKSDWNQDFYTKIKDIAKLYKNRIILQNKDYLKAYHLEGNIIELQVFDDVEKEESIPDWLK